MQDYLEAELTRLARTPTIDEFATRIQRRSGGTVGLGQAVADLHEARNGS